MSYLYASDQSKRKGGHGDGERYRLISIAVVAALCCHREPLKSGRRMRPADAYRQKHRVVDREEGAPLKLPQREEGSSLQRLDASAAAFDPVRGERQFSVLSKNALSTLDGLVGEVDKLENLLVDLEKMVGAPDDADRLAALGSVRQIVGDLDKLQATKVDAVSTAELNSGKSVARAERKNINRRIDELRPRAKRLHDALLKT